jgi:CheY-like chemotaxis protein
MLWFYRRAEEQIACEIRIAFDGRAYELHILQPDGTRTIERYADVTAALRREHELERTWKAQGWRELNEIASDSLAKRAEQPDESPVPRSTRHPGAVVLLVEDDPNTRTGYTECLASQGFVVEAAANGTDALAAANRRRPDAVVADIHLPDFDGLEVTRCLRENPETQRAPVIGLTGQWDTEITKRAQAAGMIALLLKPVAPAHLLAEIDHALDDLSARP